MSVEQPWQNAEAREARDMRERRDVNKLDSTHLARPTCLACLAFPASLACQQIHILLPVLSVGCYSRGGHEVMLAFPYNWLAYGYPPTTRHFNDRPNLAGPGGQGRSAGLQPAL